MELICRRLINFVFRQILPYIKGTSTVNYIKYTVDVWQAEYSIGWKCFVYSNSRNSNDYGIVTFTLKRKQKMRI